MVRGLALFEGLRPSSWYRAESQTDDGQIGRSTVFRVRNNQTLQLRFEEQDNLNYFNVTLDNISLAVDASPPVATADLYSFSLAAGDPVVLAKGDLALKDFRPKSMLHVKETRVEKPRFPVVDVHTHFTFARGGESPFEIIDQCLQVGLARRGLSQQRQIILAAWHFQDRKPTSWTGER